MSNRFAAVINEMRAEGQSDEQIMLAFRNELRPPMPEGTMIRGADLYVGTSVRTWFMPKGAEVLDCKPYTGPLPELKGARILTFRSRTPSGRTEMTVAPDDRFAVA